MAEGFGPHFLFDARGCRSASLTDMNEVFEFLNGLPGRIGMTKITQPHVFKYSGVEPDDWGLTCTVVIAESHLSYHSFPNRDGFVTMDIYSCKDFSVEQVLSELLEFFQPKEYDCELITRGIGLFDRGKQECSTPEYPVQTKSLSFMQSTKNFLTGFLTGLLTRIPKEG